MEGKTGKLYRIAGPVVIAKGLNARIFDVVRVGKEKLMGEVIQINDESTTIQVYENTSGLKPGEPVVNTGEPLSVELGPGLLTSIYDGIQRPLPVLEKQMGHFIERGVDAPGLDHKKLWDFKAVVKKGDEVGPGIVIGEVQETDGVMHKVMLPPNAKTSKIKDIKSGKFTVLDVVGKTDDGIELKMAQRWPVRSPRAVKQKLQPTSPLTTGQRVFDVFFPLAKGGVAAIPGPFGAGKTVSQQQLAKWSNADIIVYVGCGERGNEMTEVLTEFPHLIDPKSGKALMNRTILIANTSNMPVAAREASIYTGITLAEYYRDMGYNVAMMADSTSRWAEAMREISSRLEEMPGEEGYPAYLSTKLAEFYERAGIVNTLNGDEGSISVIGAVSPAGGDFSEPVTQSTLRVVKTFWALDAKLAQRRHFPSVNWLTSYSLYLDQLAPWFAENVASDWKDTVGTMMAILQEEEKLLEIVQLVGSDSLPDKQQLTLEVARLIREFILQQNAFHDIDTYCSLDKSYKLMKVVLEFQSLGERALSSGAKISEILETTSKDKVANAKFEDDWKAVLDGVSSDMKKEFEKL